MCGDGAAGAIDEAVGARLVRSQEPIREKNRTGEA
jgi:hypothetical protein